MKCLRAVIEISLFYIVIIFLISIAYTSIKHSKLDSNAGLHIASQGVLPELSRTFV